jgi:hypothetical protein
VGSFSVLEGKSARGARVYKQAVKLKLMHVGADSRLVKIDLPKRHTQPEDFLRPQA